MPSPQSAATTCTAVLEAGGLILDPNENAPVAPATANCSWEDGLDEKEKVGFGAAEDPPPNPWPLKGFGAGAGAKAGFGAGFAVTEAALPHGPP